MKQYLRTDQETQLSSERDRLTAQLSNPMVQDKTSVRRELRKTEQILEHQRAPELSGAELDKAIREAKEIEREVAPHMLSGEEMRKNPPGSVGRELAFQKRFKEKIIRWKNLQRQIHRGSDDPDVANFERFRQHAKASDPSMLGAQIPGKSFNFPSEKFQENFDKIDWEGRPRDLEAGEPRKKKPKKKRPPMTEAQRAHLREISKKRWDQAKARSAEASSA